MDIISFRIYCILHVEGLAAACMASSTGMESTKTMGSLAGRSNYVDGNSMNGIPDPGAAVVAEVFAAAFSSLS